MSFLQEQLFNASTYARPPGITWPIDATFTVGRANIRQQPYWLYEVLHRTGVVEDQCMRTGSIMWAHSFERLWFEVLDGRVAKVPRYVSRRRGSNWCHASEPVEPAEPAVTPWNRCERSSCVIACPQCDPRGRCAATRRKRAT